MIKVVNSGCKSESVSNFTASSPEIPALPFKKKMIRNVIKRLPDKTNPKSNICRLRIPDDLTLRFQAESCK